jgi:hypothetical protein
MPYRALLVVGFWLWPITVHAATIHVATSGVDGPGCGASASPCRTITQAAGMAVSGDRILVQPGHYSDDVDGDAVFGEPGEETFALGFATGVRVESTDGAAATIIHRRSTGAGAVVIIAADDVQFGRPNKGFTLRVPGGTNTTGLSSTSATGVVTGNVITGPVNIGFGVFGGATLRDNRVLCSSSASGVGFFALLGAGTVIDRNLVQGCNGGFLAVGSDLVLTRNLAIANSSAGGFILGDFAEFTRNAAIGNSGPGVTFNSGSTPGLFTMNTLMGNGTFAGLNCGVQNDTGGPVTATGNYWGAITGPGPDPADQVCNTAGGSVVTAPGAA